jgi:hypothetical protein
LNSLGNPSRCEQLSISENPDEIYMKKKDKFKTTKIVLFHLDWNRLLSLNKYRLCEN